MSEMVGRVALALKAALGNAMNAKPLLGDEASGDWHAEGGVIDLAVLARAAIEAMREPTEAMVEAVAFEYRGITQRDRFPSYWRAAIDEALE